MSEGSFYQRLKAHTSIPMVKVAAASGELNLNKPLYIKRMLGGKLIHVSEGACVDFKSRSAYFTWDIKEALKVGGLRLVVLPNRWLKELVTTGKLESLSHHALVFSPAAKPYTLSAKYVDCRDCADSVWNDYF